MWGVMNTNGSNVVSIVNNEILARIAANERNEAIIGFRDWVNVPYSQKEEAKELGCRWCPAEKRWYASKYVSSKQVELILRESNKKKLKK
jgi:hypothetical protein